MTALLVSWPIVCIAGPSVAQELPTAEQILGKAAQRSLGDTAIKDLQMVTVAANGNTRTRSATMLRKRVQQTQYTAFFVTAPATMQGTAFLTIAESATPAEANKADGRRATSSRRWLFLPAVGRPRRIADSARGGAFLGTDFSYDDLKNDAVLEPADFVAETLAEDPCGNQQCFVIEAKPIDRTTAEQLGYGRVTAWIDNQHWFSRKLLIYDTAEKPLKEIVFEEVREVQGVLTAHRIEARNLGTGHRSIFTFSNIRYQIEIPTEVFDEQLLHHGPPEL